MPKSYPDFPHHTQIAAYFDDYVDHFGFRERIAFETGVEHAEREADGIWTIALDDGGDAHATTRSSSPTATTGIRAGPSRRSRATFDGAQMHAHHYIDNEPFKGKTRRRRRDRQQRDGHRRRVELRRRANVPLLAPRRARHPEVPVRPAARPDRRQPLHRRAAVGVRKRDASRRSYRARRRRDGGLRAAETRPRPRRGAPDDLRRLPQPRRARRDRLQAEHRRAAGRPRALRGRHGRARSTSIVWCTGYKVTFPFFDAGLISRARQRPAAVPPRLPSRHRQRLLRRAAAAARRDHAARRGAGAVDRRLPARRVRAAGAGELRAGHRARAREDVQALRRLQAPHDAGRLRQLPLRARARAPRRRARACASTGFRLPVPARARRRRSPA